MNAIYAVAYIETWKSQELNGVWTRDFAIPVRRSNQLSYEATDVGSWSFVGSNEPVRNECEVIYEVFHITRPYRTCVSLISDSSCLVVIGVLSELWCWRLKSR